MEFCIDFIRLLETDMKPGTSESDRDVLITYLKMKENILFLYICLTKNNYLTLSTREFEN